MIDFRLTMQDPDWRVVAVLAALVIALLLIFTGKADALIALAGESIRAWVA